MATEKTEGFEKVFVFVSRKLVVICGLLFFTYNTEKDPLIIFPNKIIKNYKKHVFVKVIFV